MDSEFCGTGGIEIEVIEFRGTGGMEMEILEINGEEEEMEGLVFDTSPGFNSK